MGRVQVDPASASTSGAAVSPPEVCCSCDRNAGRRPSGWRSCVSVARCRPRAADRRVGERHRHRARFERTRRAGRRRSTFAITRRTRCREAVTDGGGRFRILYLPVGDYHLSAQLRGFHHREREPEPRASAIRSTCPIVLKAAGVAVSWTRSSAPRRWWRRGAPSSRPIDHAARSRQPAAQRAQLSRSRAAGAQRVAHQPAHDRSLCRDVGDSGHRRVRWPASAI